MKTLRLILVALALMGVGFAQADKDTYTANAADMTAQTFTFLHAEQNAYYGISHQLEMVWGSAPSTTSITATCLMRGGTVASTMFSSTSIANQTGLLSGLCDLMKVVVSWTGSPSSVKLNLTGSVQPLSLNASDCVIVSTASTNATNCKATPGVITGYDIYNTSTTIYYLRLYNTASAPTCSSATGFIRSVPIIPASAAGGSGGQIADFAIPVAYGTGISFCITAGSSSTDNTNAATGILGALRFR